MSEEICVVGIVLEFLKGHPIASLRKVFGRPKHWDAKEVAGTKGKGLEVGCRAWSLWFRLSFRKPWEHRRWERKEETSGGVQVSQDLG